jgi:hypothetical protein
MTSIVNGGPARVGPAQDPYATDMVPAVVGRELQETPRPDAMATRISAVLQPWALDSKEAVSSAVRDFVAVELEDLGQLTTVELAWAVAEFAVARQEEIVASGNLEALQGFLTLSDSARMFEHMFLATGGAQIDSALPTVDGEGLAI